MNTITSTVRNWDKWTQHEDYKLKISYGFKLRWEEINPRRYISWTGTKRKKNSHILTWNLVYNKYGVLVKKSYQLPLNSSKYKLLIALSKNSSKYVY